MAMALKIGKILFHLPDFWAFGTVRKLVGEISIPMQLVLQIYNRAHGLNILLFFETQPDSLNGILYDFKIAEESQRLLWMLAMRLHYIQTVTWTQPGYYRTAAAYL